jgi:pSer/pThr/pTyr-binding forkhead associated (FHA) protein
MNTGQSPSGGSGKRRAGPQGTQVLSAAQLQQIMRDETLASEQRASAYQPVLEGISESVRDRRFALRAGRQTIGRRNDNDIVVDDPSVSASHAWITQQHEQCVVMNTLSTNGTFVNEKRVHDAVLEHGDHVRFGQVEFRFLTREQEVRGWRRYRWTIVAIVGVLVLAALAGWLL